MAGQPARKQATYEDLCALPENMTGEIINGQLIATPRPKARHIRASSMLGSELTGPFDKGKDGPGGWWILDEPELHLSEHVCVPDIAGWKKERMPELPDSHIFDLPPDWVCEVLSPSTAKTDRTDKMPIYAAHGLKHLWILNPEFKTLEVYRLEVYRLEEGRWVVAAAYGEDQKARAEPFDALELDLSVLWA